MKDEERKMKEEIGRREKERRKRKRKEEIGRREKERRNWTEGEGKKKTKDEERK